PDLLFLHLTGDRRLVAERLAQRKGHFMPTGLLDSQFATLQPLDPDEAGGAVDVAAGPTEITEQALAALGELRAPSAQSSTTLFPPPLGPGAPASAPARVPAPRPPPP